MKRGLLIFLFACLNSISNYSQTHDKALQDSVYCDTLIYMMAMYENGELQPGDYDVKCHYTIYSVDTISRQWKGGNVLTIVSPHPSLLIKYKNQEKHGKEKGYYFWTEITNPYFGKEYCLEHEGNWKWGQKTGKWIYYGIDGKISKLEFYNKGQLIKTK